jgi:serine protease Do
MPHITGVYRMSKCIQFKRVIAIALSGLLLSSCNPKEVRVAERIQKSTVFVHIYFSRGEKHGGALCSGVVVNPHEILLADHCVDAPEGVKVDKVWIRNFNGRSQEATIEKKDRKIDLALLHVIKREIPAKIGHSVRTGQVCYTVGMPLGIEWVVSRGIVSRTDLEVPWFTKATFFVTDCTVLPGNSGGGVWSENGSLIGIVSMSSSMLGSMGAAGLGFAVDVNTIRGFIEK